LADQGDRTTGTSRADLQLDDLYREVVLDHYRRPRGRQPLSHPNRSVEGFNPSCGDQIHLALTVEGDQVKEIQVECHGCSISVASGSMMAEMVPGHDVAEVRRLIQAVKGMMQGKESDPALDLGDVEALEGVRKFPVRVKCALLAWTTMEEALQQTPGKG
jgi:nitrogen fixation protein NifU and related proteins